jgi:hypothetical protein
MSNQQTYADSEIDAGAMKHLLWRAGLTSAFMTAYSVGYLGNTPSPSVLSNSLLVGFSAVGAETCVKYISPFIVHAKATGTNGLVMMGSEVVLSGLIYSQVFPRFYGNAVPMQQLAMIAGGVDLAAQSAWPRLAAFADSSQQSY